MRCRLAVRRLEARDLPAVFTVLNLNDSGADSLRDCVAKANASPGADTINFQAGLAGTITLSSGEIAVSDAVSIQGPGLSVLTISGNNAQRLFKVSAAPAATAISFSGLTLANGMTSGFTAAGSAISGSSQALSLTSCALTNHKASGISGTGIGGAIVLTGGSLTAVNCVFSGNFATNRGGAVAIQGTGSKLTLIQCTVSNNTSASGGGIYANDNVSITACTISGNTATGDGGVNGWGGGLRIQGSGNPMIVRNSTFSGNIAQLNGGGIALTGNLVASSLTITNCTITGNSVISSAAGGGGGGISRNYSASVIALESTIVSGNVSVNGTDVLSSGTVNVKTSAIGSATGFTKTDQGGNLPFQPHANLKLGALADNGGPTLTHVPSADSPLVNAGSNPAALVNDQRGAGFPRIFGLAADIGSVEVPVFVVSNTNDSGSGSLRQVILEANGWAGPDTVTFDPAVFATPQTIKLTTGEIAIGDALTISGPAAKVTIDGNFTSRVFNTTTAPGKSAITLVNLVLTNAKASSPNSGGAIAAADESLTLRASAITNSSGGNGGGAVFISSGSLLIEDSSLAGNSAGDGGAVVVFSGGALTVRRSTLSGNTAADAGGAICFLSGGSLTVEGSTLSGNTANSTNAVAGGGAVYFSGTAAVFVVGNSTLSGNKATTTNGGAIGLRAFSGTAAIQNSTLTANSAGAGGGGVARTGGSGAVTLNSTIVAGNTNASTPDLSFNAVTNVGGNNNLIGVADAGNFTLTGKGNQAGTGFAPLDARLGPLANNGGPTFTHALLADSVAINRGANPAALANDQRGAGFPRQVGVAVDVGAVESTNSGPGVIAFDGGPGVLTPGVTAYQFTVTYADLDAINVASLDDGDITVTGPAFPGGVGAKFISVNDPTNGTPRTATYEVAAPAGGFTAAHSGIYTVSVNANQVQSVAGAFAAAATAGTFVASIGVVIVVDATNDEITDTDGKTSLREALAQANAGPGSDTIQFSPAFQTKQTITLALGELKITQSVTISGPTANLLTIDAAGKGRHFNIDNGLTGAIKVVIAGMTLTNGTSGTGDGGSIRIADESVLLSHMVITGNKAEGTSGDGGAITITASASDVTVADSTISGNSAASAGGQGGAINVDTSGKLTVLRSAISNNTAGSDGGGIYFFSGGTLVMDDCTVSGNKANTAAAGTGGGGIYLFSTTATIRNSTISGNTTAGNGGGIVIVGGSPLIQNATIAFNIALGNGGGISQSSGGATVESTIISDNSAPAGPDVNGTLASLSRSLVGKTLGLAFKAGSENLLNVDAKLTPLAFNGGPTQTHLPAGDSPARNRGSNPAGLAFDQRGGGFPRNLQGAPDIGAVESVGVIPVASATAPDVTAAGGTTQNIAVLFSDDVGIDTATLDSGDVTVTGPGGAAIPVVFTGFTGGGPAVTATYEMVAPGGAWDPHDFGTYTVVLNAGEVSDTDGTPNSVAPGPVGSFRVLIAFNPVVTVATDESDGNFAADDISLREAVLIANALPGAQVITFDPAVFATPQTIVQTLGELAITDSVTISGPAANLTIDAGKLSRHFFIDGPGTLSVALSRLTLANGNAITLSGGSIRTSDEAVTLSHITFTGNTSTGNVGGALSVVSAGAQVVVQDCVFTGNHATSRGGAIFVNAGTAGAVTVRRSTLSGNSADVDGGAVYVSSGNVTMTGCTVSGNTSNKTTAGEGGGGMRFGGAGTLTVTNCTVSGNSMLQAGAGGGLVFDNFSGNALVQNSTVTTNNAVTAGGGLARASGTGTLTVQSTIVAGNTVAGAAGANADLSFDAAADVAGDNNLVGVHDAANNVTLTGVGNQTGTLALPLDAKLGPLAANGGPTLTHALLAGSPAIDAGNNAAGLANDQRDTGFVRVSGGQTDVGAFELQPLAPPAVTAVQVNGGAAQRSRVTVLAVTFSETVSFPSGIAAAFQLERVGPGTPTGLVNLVAVQSGAEVTLTFLGGGAVPAGPGGSLTDGVYRLTVVAGQVQGAGGFMGADFVTPTDPGAPGRIHRLFGDADGDGDVDAQDFGAFRAAFGGTSNLAFDFDGDGDVDAQDFGQFRARFGSSV